MGDQRADDPTGIDRLVHLGAARAAAASTARLLAGPGKGRAPVSAAEAAEAVVSLRTSAVAAREHVARVSGLLAPAGPPAVVCDRDGWVSANLSSLSGLLGPVVADLAAGAGPGHGGRGPGRAAARVAGTEIGAVLGFLSTKVLGQFDPFATAPGGAAAQGRLLLVAPTIVAVERELEVDAEEFRLWVCLHEETHRVQFTATGWLAEHLGGEIRTLIAGLGGSIVGDPEGAAQRLAAIAGRLRDVLRGQAEATDLLAAVQSEADRDRLARLTAVMSLLEGHADVVMDDVGPEVIPGVAEIRRRFGRRRKGSGPLDKLVRRLLGLDAKARQYSEGARFVRAVQASAGAEGFAQVWSSPQTLPTPAEISDPAQWVTRVLG